MEKKSHCARPQLALPVDISADRLQTEASRISEPPTSHRDRLPAPLNADYFKTHRRPSQIHHVARRWPALEGIEEAGRWCLGTSRATSKDAESIYPRRQSRGVKDPAMFRCNVPSVVEVYPVMLEELRQRPLS